MKKRLSAEGICDKSVTQIVGHDKTFPEGSHQRAKRKNVVSAQRGESSLANERNLPRLHRMFTLPLSCYDAEYAALSGCSDPCRVPQRRCTSAVGGSDCERSAQHPLGLPNGNVSIRAEDFSALSRLKLTSGDKCRSATALYKCGTRDEVEGAKASEEVVHIHPALRTPHGRVSTSRPPVQCILSDAFRTGKQVVSSTGASGGAHPAAKTELTDFACSDASLSDSDCDSDSLNEVSSGAVAPSVTISRSCPLPSIIAMNPGRLVEARDLDYYFPPSDPPLASPYLLSWIANSSHGCPTGAPPEFLTALTLSEISPNNPIESRYNMKGSYYYKYDDARLALARKREHAAALRTLGEQLMQSQGPRARPWAVTTTKKTEETEKRKKEDGEGAVTRNIAAFLARRAARRVPRVSDEEILQSKRQLVPVNVTVGAVSYDASAGDEGNMRARRGALLQPCALCGVQFAEMNLQLTTTRANIESLQRVWAQRELLDSSRDRTIAGGANASPERISSELSCIDSSVWESPSRRIRRIRNAKIADKDVYYNNLSRPRFVPGTQRSLSPASVRAVSTYTTAISNSPYLIGFNDEESRISARTAMIVNRGRPRSVFTSLRPNKFDPGRRLGDHPTSKSTVILKSLAALGSPDYFCNTPQHIFNSTRLSSIKNNSATISDLRLPSSGSSHRLQSGNMYDKRRVCLFCAQFFSSAEGDILEPLRRAHDIVETNEKLIAECPFLSANIIPRVREHRQRARSAASEYVKRFQKFRRMNEGESGGLDEDEEDNESNYEKEKTKRSGPIATHLYDTVKKDKNAENVTSGDSEENNYVEFDPLWFMKKTVNFNTQGEDYRENIIDSVLKETMT